jgi:putative heme-binding domain-containing protein
MLMRRSFSYPLSAIALALLASISCAGEPSKLGFEVPKGFEVTLYADDSLATDIHMLTIDSKGRVVVASKGYIKILHENDKGIADQATLFADFPKSGAHGMVFDGDDLICNGDQGVRRLHDTQGVGKCDKVSPPFFKTKNDGEHSANGIKRGPDGWYYMIAGNDAGINEEHANGPGSPIKKPNAGAVVRFSPDGKTREVIAHGFRNPYDLAFNHLGHLFTVDADGERIHQMPYYAPTRVFDIGFGMHHGWILPGWARGWSRPPVWPDVVERLYEIGRGSPTGVIVYRHRNFPERYRGGLFSLCWSFGRLYFFPMTPKGSTYEAKMEVFLRTTGDVGFAPTAMAVGKHGELYIAIGGRGTRGSVFRVRYKGPPPEPYSDPLKKVLAADEPLSSWSRAEWVPIAKKLGKDVFVKAVLDEKRDLTERIRAVEVLTELFGGVGAANAEQVCKTKAPADLVARLLWSLARTDISPEARDLVGRMGRTDNPRIARAAWEAILVLATAFDEPEYRTTWESGLPSADRRVRAAVVLAAKGPARQSFMKLANKGDTEGFLALCWAEPGKEKEKVQALFADHAGSLLANNVSPALRMETVRLMQVALGDVDTDQGPEKAFLGYIARSSERWAPVDRKASDLLASAFPTGDADLDMELARLLAMLEADMPGLLYRIAHMCSPNSRAQDDIHYLMVAARLPGKRSNSTTRLIAHALNAIHAKLAAVGNPPSDQVPEILEAIFERLLKFDPALAKALVADAGFGLPGHAIYAKHLPKAEQQAATRKLLAAIGKLDEDAARTAWTPELVQLVNGLPDAEAVPILREQFADPRLTDPVALLLAARGLAEDRERYIEALSSIQPGVVQAAASALLALGAAKPQAAEIGKAVRALRRLEGQKVDAKVPQAVTALLEKWTGEKMPAADWLPWFTKTHPKAAAALPGLASADFATWKKRLDAIDWDAGDAKRGEAVFQKKSCARCHGEARRLGPDLTGIAQRFSRDDLFTAIIDPSKDILPAYRATVITTKAGKTYNGILIYDSPDLTLLQTTPDTTVRLTREELLTTQPSNVSFMPAGLLDDVADAELRDLYAYLKTLRKK